MLEVGAAHVADIAATEQLCSGFRVPRPGRTFLARAEFRFCSRDLLALTVGDCALARAAVSA
jgi:hypothetical protein